MKNRVKYLLPHCHFIRQFEVCLSSFIIALAVFSNPVLAVPQGGVVSAGEANISTNGNLVQIDQSTAKAIIDWRSFNMGSQDTTRFNQPNAGSITLNRINPNFGASVIYGQLLANGQIWLINPAG